MAGVIADASPLIALHQIGQISLIERLFGPILVPSAVARGNREKDGLSSPVSIPRRRRAGRGMDFTTPASVDHAYAVTLVRAALERRPLPHF